MIFESASYISFTIPVSGILVCIPDNGIGVEISISSAWSQAVISCGIIFQEKCVCEFGNALQIAGVVGVVLTPTCILRDSQEIDVQYNGFG